MTQDEAMKKWGYVWQTDATPNFESTDYKTSLVAPAELQAQHPGQYPIGFYSDGTPVWGNIDYGDAAGGVGPLLVVAAALAGNPGLLAGLGGSAGAGAVGSAAGESAALGSLGSGLTGVDLAGAGLAGTTPAMAGALGSGLSGTTLASLGLDAGALGAGAFGAVGGLGDAGFSEALAGAGTSGELPSWLTANASDIGGSLQDLAFPQFSAPYASYPAAEVSTALPGLVPTEVTTPSIVAEGSTVPGSFWENVSTPFKTAANVLEEGAKSPIVKTLSNAKKVYDIYGALTQDTSAPVPQTISQQSNTRRGYMPQPFGNRNFDAYR